MNACVLSLVSDVFQRRLNFLFDRNALGRKALILVWIGFLWNFLEAGVALWSALTSSSVALFAFGLDSIIEICA